MLSSNYSLDVIILPWVKPTERLTTRTGITVGGVNSYVQLPTPQHQSNSTLNFPVQQLTWVLLEGSVKPIIQLFNQIGVHRYLLDIVATLLHATASGLCQPCYDHKSVMKYIHASPKTYIDKLVKQTCKNSGDTMSHAIHSTLGGSCHGTIGTQSSIYLGVLLGPYQVLGTA